MEKKALIVKKCIGNIEDRILGVQNDLKAFLYIRKHNLQHGKDDIGGGNIVVALSLFTCLNFLGKTYDCTVRPDQFKADGQAKNETETFVQFMRFVKDSGINLGLSTDEETLKRVWRGFRNYLAHRLTVEPGKSVLTFTFEPDEKGSIQEILLKAKAHQVFKDDGDGRNWILNGDSLLAHLPDIVNKTVDFIKNAEEVDTSLLLKVIGVEYP